MDANSIEAFSRNIAPLVEKCERYIKSGEELSEDDVKTRLIEPFFEKLGWDFEDNNKLNQVREQKNQPAGKPDYIFYDPNGRILFFLEAKKLKDIKEEDIKQAYGYAFRKNKRWAVLTNFKEILILICDKKEDSVLKHIYKRLSFESYLEHLPDLALLSPESFSNGLIDKKAAEEGQLRKQTDINEELLNDITKWRKKLANSIRKNNGKTYSNEDLSEIVQVLLDRIIFIRTVEDRKKEAIPDQLLRELIKNYDANPRLNLKAELNRIFQSYDTIYDSKLFTYDESDSKNRHECERVQIDNNTLYEILKGTYESGETIEYKFDEIDADILGAMYENYLGQIQERKKSGGIYYTPDYIVDFIILKTLDEHLQTKAKPPLKPKVLDIACGSGSFLIKAFDSLNDYYKEKDPERYAQRKLAQGTKMTRGGQDFILENNIYGVDVDAKACGVAKLNLLLKAMEDPVVQPHKLPELEKNILHGDSIEETNSLAMNWTKAFPEGVDIVIGNPPYIGWNKIKPRKSLESGRFTDLNYHCRPNHADAQPNLYLFFVIRGLSLCKDKLGYILPNEWLSAKYAEDFRNYFLDACGKITIYKFRPDYKVFKTHGTVGTNSIIAIFDKNSKEKIVEQYYLNTTDEAEVKFALKSQKRLEKISEYSSLAFNDIKGKDWKILSTRSSKTPKKNSSVPISDKTFFKVVGGFQPPIERIKDYELSSAELRNLPKNEHKLVYPAVLDANSLKEYELVSEERHWIIANDLGLKQLEEQYPTIYKLLSGRIRHKNDEWWKFPNIRNWELFKTHPTKILHPRTAYANSFSLDEEGTLFKGTNTAIVSLKLDPYYVLGVLNSKCINEWYVNHGMEYHGSESKKYEPEKIRDSGIPIPILDKAKEEKIAKNAKEITQLKQETKTMSNTLQKSARLEKIEALKQEIDDIVEKTLFG